jgi:hypothetical protein
MLFRLRHDELRGLIDGVVGSVPVDDDSIDSPADHVINLGVNLRRIGGAVADIHVIRLSEPQKQVGVDLGCSSGVEQGMNVDLADISRTQIAVGLRRKTIRCAGIVIDLRAQRGRGHDIVARETHHGHTQNNDYNN